MMGALIALVGVAGAFFLYHRQRQMRDAAAPPQLPGTPGQTPPPVDPNGPQPPAISPCLLTNPALAAEFQSLMADVSVPPASLEVAANMIDQLGCSGEAAALRIEAARRRAGGAGAPPGPGGFPFPIPGGGGVPPFFPTQTAGFGAAAPPGSVADIAGWMESLRRAA